MKRFFNLLVAVPFTVCLNSCNTVSEKQIAIRPSPIDSFTVSGIDVGQQVQDFKYVNDTTLCSYDLISQTLVFFHKNKNGNYNASLKKEIDTEFWSAFFIGDDHNNCFIDPENNLTIYDPAADKLLWKKNLNHSFKFLKDTFDMFSPNNAPIFKLKDTIITAIAHGSLENYKNYFKEQEIAEFKIDKEKDTITYIRSYITKPANLSSCEDPFGLYCFLNNTIFLLYPPVDTMYIFNRSTNTTSKIHINNADYKLPDKFACKPFTPEYGSCATKYVLHNFGYRAIRYNPLTKHFILFYKAPVSDTIQGRIPTHDDQPLQALVLDEQFKQINHLIFTKKFVSSMSFFFIPGKGFAMPIYKGNDFETSLFYIYNL